MAELTYPQQLHNRATQGEVLTAAEEALLKDWYAQQDALEGALLTANVPSSRLSVETLQAQVNTSLAELQTVAAHIRTLTEENQAIRSDIDLRLQELTVLSRDRQPLDCVKAYSRSEIEFEELTPEEEADVMDAVKQGEADYAAGNYLTLDDLKQKYADRLQSMSE